MSVTGGGEMVVGLSLDDQMSGALRMAADNLTAFGGSAERALMALGRLGPAAAGIAGIGIALKAGVSAAAELQQQVANLNAVLAATPNQMQQVMQKSLDLSRTSQFTATQILAAQTQLAKAGGSPGQVIGQSQDVLNLASATFSSPTQAANAYIAVQKDFRLATSDSTTIVNDLARAVDSSTGTLQTFMNAYKQIGPTASAANVSMHDTNVALADLMNAGLGDQAGTAYKTFLQRIQHETPAAQQAVKDLGLSFYDQFGQMRSVADIADQLRMKTAALSDEQKNSALYSIFGARGVRVADVFSTEGAQGLSDIEQHMAGIGSASDIAATKLDTLQGQAHILASSLNILAVQGGQTVLPMFQGLTSGATDAVNALTRLNQVSPLIPQVGLGVAAVSALGAFNARRGGNSPMTIADQAQAQIKAQYQQDLVKAQVIEQQNQDALATFTKSGGLGLPPLPTTVPVPVKPDFLLVEEEAAAATFKGRIGGFMGKLSGTLGELVLPVTIALVAKELIVNPINQALFQHTADQRTGGTLDTSRFAPDSQQGIAEAKAYIAQQQAVIDGLNGSHNGASRLTDKLSGGALYSSRNDTTVKDAKANIAEAQQFIDKASADMKAAPETAITAAQDRLTGLMKDVGNGKTMLADAEAAWKGYGSEVGEGTAQVLQAAGVTASKANQIIADGNKQLEAQLQSFRTQQHAAFAAADAEMDQYKRNVDDMRKAQGMGASDAIATGAAFGLDLQGNKLDAQQKAAYTKDLQDITQAWKDAESAIGRVDLSKGIAGIVAAADPLKKAVAELAKYSITDAQLSSLSLMANDFRAISDATDKASAAMEGYQLTLTQTNKSIAEIGSLKGEFLAALDAAEQRQQRGTADQSDLDIIKSADSVLGSLDQTTGHLQQSANKDILGKVSNLLDYERADQITRDMVAQWGGGKQIVMDVQAETRKALDDIMAIENGDYHAKLYMDVIYGQPNTGAPPPPPAGRDYSGLTVPFPGPATTGAAPAGSSGPPPIPGGWGYQALGPQTPGYTPGAAGPGPTSTPNGDARILAPYEDDILAAAKANNIPPWMLAAIIMHESSGVAGIQNSQGSGALGLTQIIPSGPGWSRNYTPEQMALLTGSGPDAAKFQIDQGAKIYADFLKSNNNDPRAALAAYGGNDPGYYDTLVDQYEQPVQNAIGTGRGAGEPMGAATNAAFSVGNALGKIPSTTGISGSAIAADANQHINDAYQIDGEPWYMWCEKFVDDELQKVTGSTYRPVSAAQRVVDAQNGVKGAGTIIDQAQAQAGDLVAFAASDAPGMAQGHVGINEGNGTYVSTTSAGIQIRPIPADAIFIRPDGVVAGGPEAGTRVASVPNIGTKSAVGTSSTIPVPITRDVSLDAGRVSQLLSNADAQTIADANKMYTTALPLMQKIAADQMHNGAGPQTQTERDDANRRGGQGALKVEGATAQYLLDAKNHTGDIAADLKEIVSMGGPLGQVFGAMAVNSANIAAATAKQKQDQADLVKMNQDWTLTQAAWAAADKTTANDRRVADLKDQQAATALQRKDTRDDWKVQDLQKAEQDRWKITRDNMAIATQQENDAWQDKQYNYNEELRAIDRTGTLRQRQLADEKTSLDRNYAAQTSHTRANEQLLLADSRAANSLTPGSGNAAAVQLAIMNAGNLTKQDIYKQAQQDLQDAGLAANRLAEDEKFNIQTQETLDSRAHDLVLRHLRDEQTAEQKLEDSKQQGWAADATAIQRQRTLDQWKYQDEQLGTQLTREAIDRDTAETRQQLQVAHDNQIANQQGVITKDGDILKGYQDIGGALDGLLTQYAQGNLLFGQSASILLNLAGGLSAQAGSANDTLYYNATKGLTTSSGVPYNQFPAPGASKGYASGTDAATAGIHPVAERGAELVFKGGETVLNNSNTMALLAALAQPSNVTPISAAPSWTGDININIDGGNAILDDLSTAKVKKMIQDEIAATAARTAAKTSGRTIGGMR